MVITTSTQSAPTITDADAQRLVIRRPCPERLRGPPVTCVGRQGARREASLASCPYLLTFTYMRPPSPFMYRGSIALSTFVCIRIQEIQNDLDERCNC